VFTERIDNWWPQSHRRTAESHLVLEPRVGGALLDISPAGEARLGEVRVWNPPEQLIYTWYPGAVTGPTEVDVRFFDDGECTRVEVVHREAGAAMGDAWPEQATVFEKGWSAVLPAFAEAVCSDDR
jgi:uncharacterized protein YndB with AHSA1/START domain